MFDPSIYTTRPSFILGYHGCEKNVGEAILSGQQKHLKKSSQDYDWLGEGIYFWENSPQRALEFAHDKKARGEVKEPFILGAVIDLKNCLDFLDRRDVDLLKKSYEALRNTFDLANVDRESKLEIPQNSLLVDGVTMKRYLDCAVIRKLHTIAKVEKQTEYDSVRSLFIEGEAPYKGAGFRDKNHIQLCIMNKRCIQGYFRLID